MKLAIAFACLASAVALSGCASIGALTPAAQTQVTNAFNAVCPSVTSGALDPIVAQFNANAQKAYSAAQSICANGAPTNIVVAGLDILAVQPLLAPYIAKVHVSTSGVTVR